MLAHSLAPLPLFALLLGAACSEGGSAEVLAAACAPDGSASCTVDLDGLGIDPERHFGRDPEFFRGALSVDAESFHCGFCEQEVTREDDCAGATRGATWYGLWEDAVAEVERTGKPLLIHFGSPRHIQVCGVW